MQNQNTQSTAGITHRLETVGIRDLIQSIKAPDYTFVEAPASLMVSSVTVDRRFMQRYVESFLGEGVNAEFCARILVRDDVRADVMRHLTNDTIDKALVSIYGTSDVTVNRKITSRADMMASLSRAGVSADALPVFAEFMLAWLQKYGGVMTEQSWHDTSVHTQLHPGYDDFVIDFLAREVEKQMMEAAPFILPNEGARIGLQVVTRRLKTAARDLAITLRNVGDYASYADDMFRLVKHFVLQSVPGYTHLLQLENGNSIAQDVINHSAVRELAANLTIVKIALTEKKYVTSPNLENSPETLLRNIEKIVSLFNDSKRYLKLSLRDFAEAWSKKTLKNRKQEPTIALLSYNIKGAPAIQALNFITDERASLDVTYPAEASRVDMAFTGMYGTLLDAFKSTTIQDLTADVLTTVVEVNNPLDYGVLTLTPSIIQEDHIVALAAYHCSEFVVAATSKDGLDFAFGYRVDLTDVNVEPKSGARAFNSAILFDPAEVLMVCRDWQGSMVLDNRVQVLPEKALRTYLTHFSLDECVGIRRNRRYNLTVNANDYQVVLSPQVVFGIKYDAGAQLVRPLLNEIVVKDALVVLKALVEACQSMIDEGPRMYLLKSIYAHVRELPNMLAPDIRARIQKVVRDIITSNTTPEDRAYTEAKLTMAYYKDVIDAIIVDFVLATLGLVDEDEKFLQYYNSEAYVASFNVMR